MDERRPNACRRTDGRRRLAAYAALGALAAAAVALIFAPAGALAYIERLYSLDEILKESSHVLVGKLEKIDRAKRLAIARIERPLKGDGEYARVKMNIGLGPADQAAYLLEGWEEGAPVILFYKRDGANIASLGHAGGIWFQLFATHEEKTESVWWRFTHLEVYLGRTFNGGTPELIALAGDVLAKRRPAPAPDPRVPQLDIRRPRRPGSGPPAAAAGAAPRVRTAVARGAKWKYARGTTDAVRAPWRERDFDDSSWASGAAPLGYGDPPFGTVIEDLQKREGNAGSSSLLLRHRFEVADPAAVVAIECDVDYDDGFILWLNGKLAAGANAPGSPNNAPGGPNNAPGERLASGNHESGAYETFRIEAPRDFLVRGANVAAVEVCNVEPGSSDLKLDLELRLLLAERRPATFRRLLELPLPAAAEARGISWADVNGDEKLDICLARSSGNVLLLNEGENLRDAARDLGLAVASRSTAWADYDGDDHPDLLTDKFLVHTSAAGALRADAGLLPVPALLNTEGAGWIDANGDGRPDILITNGIHGTALFENTGKGPAWFRDVSTAAGFGPEGIAKGNGNFIAFGDYDADGYTDFFYNLDGGLLARGEGNGAFAAERDTGIEIPADEGKRGTAFADMDNDGDLDLFVPAAGQPRLYRNENDGTFVDVLAAAGDLASSPEGSFSPAWGDVDHDGRLDLFVCHTRGPSRLYLGGAGGKFSNRTAEAGLDGLNPAFAASFADLDADGDLDLAVHLEASAVVLLNELPKRAGSGSLTVRLRARRGTTGAAVRVLDPAGRLVGLREVGGAEGCGGQASPLAHFGLAAGKYRVSAALTDGRVAQREVEVGAGAGAALTLRDDDFTGGKGR